jgi:hypothetical protein
VFPIGRAGSSTIASEVFSQPPRFVNLDECSLVATFGTLLKESMVLKYIHLT